MSNPAGEGDLLRSGWQARSRQEKVGARDKMQPSLLDRLTDNDPEKKRESANSNLITHAALRRNVLRDLQWLFNTINHDASGDLSALPHVNRSVVNFGVAPLAGKRMSDIEWHDIQRKLTEAIINFEPRWICTTCSPSRSKGVCGVCRTRWSFCFVPMSIWKTAILN